jgi:hypothetical protein
MEPIKSFTVGNLRVEIRADSDPPSPREDDNLGRMICFHERYYLGDEHTYRHADYAGWEELEAAIQKNEDAAIILPLYLMDHSGISISTSADRFRACDGAGWDWGQVGFIVGTRAALRKEYGRLTKKRIAQAIRVLIGEVETYDQYLSGDVYGYEILQDGDVIDSCWGFYGIEHVRAEARRVAEAQLPRQNCELNHDSPSL